ncbi:MAG TPA: OmpA family protein [Prolixibacteraceae bacterium]|nr:OmpA family protein [Prolixibacteraceae bacterium]
MIPRSGSIIALIFLLVLGTGCSVSRNTRMAATSFENGEYFKCIAEYRKVYAKTKDRDKKAEIQLKIAESYYRIGQYRQAESYFKSAVYKEPSDKTILLRYAEVLRSNGKYEESIKTYQRFLTHMPKDERALNGITSCNACQEMMKNLTLYKIENLKEINSRWSDYAGVYPGLIETELVFTSSRDDATGKKKSPVSGEFNADIYRSVFNAEKKRWDAPKRIDESLMINTVEEEGAPSFDKSGNTLFFTRSSSEKGEDAKVGIFESTLISGTWGRPAKLTIGRDSLLMAQPSVSKEGDLIYFASNRTGGFGGNDIWVAEKKGESSWGEPRNLGAGINTAGNEMFPFIRENGALYFASDSHVGLGGLDIFKATPDANGQWTVENMGVPINSTGDDFAISFYPGEEKGLFSSFREGSRGDDIYSFLLPPKTYGVEGRLYNKETGEQVEGASVRLIGTDGTMLRLKSDNAAFRFQLKPGVEYLITAFKRGFLNAKASVSTVGMDQGKAFSVRMELTPVDQPIRIENIFYELGKWDLLPESVASLDTLVSLLKQNPTVAIELMAHTDCRGNDADNDILSQKRAQSVVDYLISKGIQQGRLTAKGYGEKVPKTVDVRAVKIYPFLKKGQVLKCQFIEALKKEDEREICHQLNRRTEFKVISSEYREKYTP